MTSDRHYLESIVDLINPVDLPAIDVFGPQVSFLTPIDGGADDICVIRGVLPPGVVVPLHAHVDFEAFFSVSGGHEVLVEGSDGLHWRTARPGDYVTVPGDALHAHRNVSGQEAVDLIVTTPRIGRFFREIGRPVGSPPPTVAELQHFQEVVDRYGYRLGTAAENAAVGIELPPVG